MYAAFQGMATRARNERPAGDRKQEYFREFRRAPIPSFNSEGGPQEAEFWIDSIVKHLSTICNDWENIKSKSDSPVFDGNYSRNRK